jgi:D-tyrosyl-tRNA(Tyr) deacylase
MVLIGVAKTDETRDVDYLVEKILNLRVFEDENGKMNKSLIEINGEMLVISQFTLLGNCRKGRRPSFIEAAEPEKANALYENFIDQVRQHGVSAKTGQFRAMMDVFLINDGPVTLILESRW